MLANNANNNWCCFGYCCDGGEMKAAEKGREVLICDLDDDCRWAT
jgi:hypothetical protein